jgi:hypothetical protein
MFSLHRDATFVNFALLNARSIGPRGHKMFLLAGAKENHAAASI